jgi:radical SAM superfamily enzyme YgiQ (UPF0313 family)
MERVKASASWPPLGLLYMATLLNEKGVEASILDQPAMGYSNDETIDWVLSENPVVAGFSGLSMTGENAALMSIEVKKRNPNILIVFGGPYATLNSNRVLSKYPSVDVVVRGEGEETILELVDTLDSGRSLRDVDGITYRDGDSFVSNPDRPLLDELNSLPFPDRKLLDCEYHSEISGVKIATKKFTSIVSSRGCTYKCRFCSCTKLCKGRWRARSVDNILEELNYLASEGFEQFIFVDDSFTLDPKRAKKICTRIRKEGLSFEWICEARVNNVSYEVLKEMSRSGCEILYLGIESASQRILNYYRKQITPDQSLKAVNAARKAGIELIMGTFILGAPDEKRDEIKNTIDFAKKLDIDIPQFNILSVYPGTEIWEDLHAMGVIDEKKYWESGVEVSKVYPTPVPYDKLVELILDAYIEFTLRPGFLLRQISRTLTSSYRKNVFMNNLGNIGQVIKTIRNPGL